MPLKQHNSRNTLSAILIAFAGGGAFSFDISYNYLIKMAVQPINSRFSYKEAIPWRNIVFYPWTEGVSAA